MSTDPLQEFVPSNICGGDKVPYLSPIAENLWMGGVHPDLILPSFCQNLISLYPWERYKVYHGLETEVYARMHDSAVIDVELVKRLAHWVRHCVQKGPTIVHCENGFNRSSLVVSLALMTDGWAAKTAITFLREQRSRFCLSNTTYEKWLLRHDQSTITTKKGQITK